MDVLFCFDKIIQKFGAKVLNNFKIGFFTGEMELFEAK